MAAGATSSSLGAKAVSKAKGLKGQESSTVHSPVLPLACLLPLEKSNTGGTG